MEQTKEDFKDFLKRMGLTQRRELVFFSGENLREWITGMDCCFVENRVPEEFRLSVAMGCIHGAALSQVKFWERIYSFQSWLELRKMVWDRFTQYQPREQQTEKQIHENDVEVMKKGEDKAEEEIDGVEKKNTVAGKVECCFVAIVEDEGAVFISEEVEDGKMEGEATEVFALGEATIEREYKEMEEEVTGSCKMNLLMAAREEEGVGGHIAKEGVVTDEQAAVREKEKKNMADLLQENSEEEKEEDEMQEEEKIEEKTEDGILVDEDAAMAAAGVEEEIVDKEKKNFVVVEMEVGGGGVGKLEAAGDGDFTSVWVTTLICLEKEGSAALGFFVKCEKSVKLGHFDLDLPRPNQK